MTGVLDRVHSDYVFGRRVRVLLDQIAPLLPANARVLDVGCGDGSLARLVMERRPDVTLEGIDVLVRPNCQIDVRPFDGRTIPSPDASFDVVLFVDVLHHADDAMALLREAMRVTRGCVVIKDHTQDGLLARQTLRFMDWVGNARHGVALPYNYWSRRQWDEAIKTLDARVDAWVSRLGLYPRWADWAFGRGLHFVARLLPPVRG